MYVLIIVFAILSPATGTVTPVGVTSQTIGNFKSLEECKAAGNHAPVGGVMSDLSLSRGVYWYCVHAGTRPSARAR